MKTHRLNPALAVVVVLLLSGAAAHAGTIEEILGTDYQDKAPTNPATNNDNYSKPTNNPNKAYYDVYDDGTVPHRDVRFHVLYSGGTAKYAVYSNPDNLTGNTWHGFQMELGFFTGADFVRSTAADLDFDTPNKDRLVSFDSHKPPQVWDPNVMGWTGLDFLTNNQTLCLYDLDVPDLQPGAPGVPADAITYVDGVAVGYSFTIRLTGISPEPGTLALLALPVVALIGRRRS